MSVNTSEKPEVSFAGYSSLFEKARGQFVKIGRSVIATLKRATEKLQEAKAELKPFGLQIAVLVHRFGELSTSAEWAGRSVMEYLAHSFELGKSDRIPPVAFANARVFLATCMGESPIWTEADYLAVSQKALTTLGRILFHKGTQKANQSGPNLEHPTIVEAVDVATKRAEKYEQKLAELLAGLDPEKPLVEITDENLRVVVQLLDAFLASGEWDFSKEETKEIFAEIDLASLVETAQAVMLELGETPAPAPEPAPKPAKKANAFALCAKEIAPAGFPQKTATKAVKAYHVERGRFPTSWGEVDAMMKAAAAKAPAKA